MLPEFCKCRVHRNRKAQGVNLMKNYIAVIVTIVFLICSSICFSSYRIELKNGSTFMTNHYWKEGRQIKFYYYGGVVGINKDFIREIKDSDLSYKEAVLEQEALETSDQTPEIGSREAGEKAREEIERKRKDIDVAYYQKKKSALKEKYWEARENLKQARMARNKIAVRDAKKEIKVIRSHQAELALKLKKENNGMFPAWWHSESKPE